MPLRVSRLTTPGSAVMFCYTVTGPLKKEGEHPPEKKQFIHQQYGDGKRDVIERSQRERSHEDRRGKRGQGKQNN